jgi:nitrogen fixation/metabolism regulation signal transduction histidine kinase
MGSKDEIIPQVVLIAILGMLVGVLLKSNNVAFLGILIIIFIFFLIKRMVKPLEDRNKDVTSLISMVKKSGGQISGDYRPHSQIGVQLKQTFEEQSRQIQEKLQQVLKKDNYLKNIVQHAGVGILTVKPGGKVDIINAEAKHLLQVSSLYNIAELNDRAPGFVEQVSTMKTGGKSLIHLPNGDGMLPVSMYVIELAWEGEIIKLLSLQNIQSELDEKEMEAWQNLIRILTHEIMNSVTPISSLAATIEEELTTVSEDRGLSVDEVEDVRLGVKTIRKRSEGLIRFVSDFRNLTRVPNPNRKVTEIRPFFQEIILLMQPEIKKTQAEVSIQVSPEDICIDFDKELIAQVMINLVKNACEAMQNNEEDKVRLLSLKAGLSVEGKPEIIIEDSGPGIDEEALQRIFIPFFTTKKTGSGIGLSLSKQIMRKHDGNILVSSQFNKGTKFTLRF